MIETNFSSETRKILGLAILTTLATGLVQWGLEELKKFSASRRKRVETDPETEPKTESCCARDAQGRSCDCDK